MGKADLLAAQKDYTNAEKITLNLYKDYPYNLALLIELSDFYISAQQPQKARDILKDSLKRRTGLAVLYSLLARAYVDLREEKNALITQADYFAARWNYEAAIRQIEMAKKTPPINDYETSILEAKKKKYEAALAQQEKLKKELG